MESSDGPGPVGGVVLSAGRSTRMGEAKALLEVEGRTFLVAAVETLLGGGCRDVVVVVSDERLAEAAGALPVTIARNADRRSEQVDSIRVGLAALPADVSAAVVLPVDHPLVKAETVAALIDAARSSSRAMVRPTYGGRPGHPTLFPRAVWSRLQDPSLDRGARSVVESPDTPTVDVAVDDPGVLADIDTPAAYRRWVADRSEPAT